MSQFSASGCLQGHILTLFPDEVGGVIHERYCYVEARNPGADLFLLLLLLEKKSEI